MVSIGKDVLGGKSKKDFDLLSYMPPQKLGVTYKKETIHFVGPVKPKTELGRLEKEILWTLVSLGDMNYEELTKNVKKESKTSLRRLIDKKLVELSPKKKVISPTKEGRGIILHYALKGKSWEGWQKLPKVNSKFKLVAFDLDDTLVPGFVKSEYDFDVETMRRILLMLKRNNIRTAVLSINPQSTVYRKLRNFGLLELIDFPFQTDKTNGMKKLMKFTGYKPEEILFAGHDVMSDWTSIKNADKNIPVVMFRDTFGYGDSKGSVPKVEGLLVIDRDLIQFRDVLEGKIKETDNKDKLMDEMSKHKPAVTYVTTYADKKFFKGDKIKILVETKKYYPKEPELKGKIGLITELKSPSGYIVEFQDLPGKQFTFFNHELSLENSITTAITNVKDEDKTKWWQFGQFG